MEQYLTTSEVAALFWPASSWAATRARKRLRWLRDLRVVTRWWQMLPTVEGWRRLPSVWMLT